MSVPTPAAVPTRHPSTSSRHCEPSVAAAGSGIREVGATVTLGTLDGHLASIENDESEGAISTGERRRVSVGPSQCHLRKMDDFGVVGVDTPRGWTEPTDRDDLLHRIVVGRW